MLTSDREKKALWIGLQKNHKAVFVIATEARIYECIFHIHTGISNKKEIRPAPFPQFRCPPSSRNPGHSFVLLRHPAAWVRHFLYSNRLTFRTPPFSFKFTRLAHNNVPPPTTKFSIIKNHGLSRRNGTLPARQSHLQLVRFPKGAQAPLSRLSLRTGFAVTSIGSVSLKMKIYLHSVSRQVPAAFPAQHHLILRSVNPG